MKQWVNDTFRVNHVAINGSTACYSYEAAREVWIVRLDGSPSGLAPDQDGAKEVAERLLHAVDETHIHRAFASLRWAEENWPSAGSKVWLKEIETHHPDTCRQAVVEVLKRGTLT